MGLICLWYAGGWCPHTHTRGHTIAGLGAKEAMPMEPKVGLSSLDLVTVPFGAKILGKLVDRLRCLIWGDEPQVWGAIWPTL